MYNELIGKTVEEAQEFCRQKSIPYELENVKSYRYYDYDTKLIVRVREINGKLVISYSDFMLNVDGKTN